MARLKTGPKVILIILLVGAFVFGLRKAAEMG
jgi:Sec-independent protein translocase protein TatA